MFSSGKILSTPVTPKIVSVARARSEGTQGCWGNGPREPECVTSGSDNGSRKACWLRTLRFQRSRRGRRPLQCMYGRSGAAFDFEKCGKYVLHWSGCRMYTLRKCFLSPDTTSTSPSSRHDLPQNLRFAPCIKYHPQKAVLLADHTNGRRDRPNTQSACRPAGPSSD